MSRIDWKNKVFLLFFHTGNELHVFLFLIWRWFWRFYKIKKLFSVTHREQVKKSKKYFFFKINMENTTYIYSLQILIKLLVIFIAVQIFERNGVYKPATLVLLQVKLEERFFSNSSPYFRFLFILNIQSCSNKNFDAAYCRKRYRGQTTKARRALNGALGESIRASQFLIHFFVFYKDPLSENKCW